MTEPVLQREHVSRSGLASDLGRAHLRVTGSERTDVLATAVPTHGVSGKKCDKFPDFAPVPRGPSQKSSATPSRGGRRSVAADERGFLDRTYRSGVEPPDRGDAQSDPRSPRATGLGGYVEIRIRGRSVLQTRRYTFTNTHVPRTPHTIGHGDANTHRTGERKGRRIGDGASHATSDGGPQQSKQPRSPFCPSGLSFSFSLRCSPEPGCGRKQRLNIGTRASPSMHHPGQMIIR